MDEIVSSETKKTAIKETLEDAYTCDFVSTPIPSFAPHKVSREDIWDHKIISEHLHYLESLYSGRSTQSNGATSLPAIHCCSVDLCMLFMALVLFTLCSVRDF